jgi:ankyrin repeat protein
MLKRLQDTPLQNKLALGVLIPLLGISLWAVLFPAHFKTSTNTLRSSSRAPKVLEAARDKILSIGDDDGEIIFADDVKSLDTLKRFLKAAGDANYIPLPMENEGPYGGDDDSGLTLLHWAAFYNQVDSVQLLLEYGAKVDTKDLKGKTAMDLAKSAKASPRILELLSAPTNRNRRLSVS